MIANSLKVVISKYWDNSNGESDKIATVKVLVVAVAISAIIWTVVVVMKPSKAVMFWECLGKWCQVKGMPFHTMGLFDAWRQTSKKQEKESKESTLLEKRAETQMNKKSYTRHK